VVTTFDGLVRFDGVRFTVFNKGNSSGIINNRFVHLYEDGQGDLWASTESSGLTRLRQDRFTIYTTANGLPDNTINSIGGDGQGNLLIFFGFRPIRWVEDKFQPADDLHLTGNPVASDLAQHPAGFMTPSEAVFFVGGQLHRWKTGAELQFLFRQLAQDHNSILWLSSQAGLHQPRAFFVSHPAQQPRRHARRRQTRARTTHAHRTPRPETDRRRPNEP